MLKFKRKNIYHGLFEDLRLCPDTSLSVLEMCRNLISGIPNDGFLLNALKTGLGSDPEFLSISSRNAS